MIKITGKITVTGRVRYSDFSGWENISVAWDDSQLFWDYWA